MNTPFSKLKENKATFLPPHPTPNFKLTWLFNIIVFISEWYVPGTDFQVHICWAIGS